MSRFHSCHLSDQPHAVQIGVLEGDVGDNNNTVQARCQRIHRERTGHSKTVNGIILHIIKGTQKVLGR